MPISSDLTLNLLTALSSFILAVLIIVTIHELGHYLVGRWRGIGADVFSVGFGPELIAFTDRRGTRWRLAALPLGGYVRFRGDASAASAPSGARGEGSFEGASLLSRTLTVLAGPVANFLLSILLISGAALWSGVPDEEARVGSPRAHPVPSGLVAGDLVRSVAGVPVADLSGLLEVSSDLPTGSPIDWVVIRDGSELTVTAPRPMSGLLDRVGPLTPAHRAGLRSGDVIIAVEGDPVEDFSALRARVLSGEGEELRLLVWRDGTERELRVSPERSDHPAAGGGFETRWTLGVSAGLPFEPGMRRPGPLEALSIGTERTWAVLSLTGSALANMVTGAISHCNMRGVLSMGEVSGASASEGAMSFVTFLAILSIAIGFMNLLPVPTLDGGHLVLYAWEAVRGRAPSPKVTSAMMTAGMVILIALMGLGLINDLTC